MVLVSDGKIVEIAASAARPMPAGTQTLDLGASMIAPGYIDLHIHGSAGFDVMDDDADALPVVERLLARHGVTGYYPTTVTCPCGDSFTANLAKSINAGRTPAIRDKIIRGEFHQVVCPTCGRKAAVERPFGAAR